MGTQNISRFRRRAEEERAKAAKAIDPRQASQCLELAAKYEAVAQAYEGLGS
ncbi:MAG TPA: hypothetical protein VHM92_07295 [Allosphingosinicella sp.]|nr:hypothetical protein [Allosphingosinicella sp.]